MSMSLTTGQTRAQLLDPWRVGDGRIEYADETVGRPPTAGGLSRLGRVDKRALRGAPLLNEPVFAEDEHPLVGGVPTGLLIPEVVPWPDRCFAVGAPEQRDDLALMHALLHLTRPRARDRIAGRSAPSDAVVVLTL